MKPILLEYLVCPDCQATLVCDVVTEKEGDIEKGTLNCSQCGKDYPIVRGIPRFITADYPLLENNVRTVDAFGWQWQKFDQLHDLLDYERQFLDWVYPISPEFFQDKVVLDAGCGMGRFSLVSSKFGAKLVLAIDASQSVEAARNNTHNVSNIQVIQADISNLPLRRTRQAQVDFCFSIGVLHHLDNPQAGFNALVRHLKPDGTIYAWVYGRENNGWVINVVNPIRTMLTSRLPRHALYVLSWLITCGLHPLLKIVYAPANTKDTLHWLRKILPYADYLVWLSQFEFRHNHHVVFDHLVAPVAFYLRREEFEAWFREANLELINLSWRNSNSWRGHGRLPKLYKQ